jgi:hypothetical protein
MSVSYITNFFFSRLHRELAFLDVNLRAKVHHFLFPSKRKLGAYAKLSFYYCPEYWLRSGT